AAADKKWSEHLKQVRLLKIGLVLWLAAIPAGYAIFEFLGPAWLGLIGLILVLWNALKTALKIWGYTKPSAQEEKEAEKRRKMRHYFYHCERNPDGFRRLMIENLENEAREQIRKKAQELSRDGNNGDGSSRQPI
ncbi:MAG: hypothetical protein ACLFV8_11495, partial [Alphaproteobacteria bacterium]